MLYQRKTLPDTNIGPPAELPPGISALADTDLADLSAALGPAAGELGYSGQGFFPVLRTISALAFKQRLTSDERKGIRDAAATDKNVADWLDLLNTPGEGLIELDHPDTVNGLAYLVAHSLLTADRAAQIRA